MTATGDVTARSEGLAIVPKKAVEDIFRDFCEDFAKLEGHYFGAPQDLEKYVEMTSDPYLRLVKREPLYEALKDYAEALDAPAASKANVDALRRDGNYCVLAWQHPYLLGGPAETFLKCLTAVLLCRKLNERGEGNFIPVLWAETDFHDLTEVNRVHLPRGDALVEERLDVDEHPRPAIDVGTGEAYDALVARLEGLLPGSHRGWLMETLAACRGSDLGDHFARLMVRVFGEHGLVVAAPHVLRQQTAELIARAIESADDVERLLERSKRQLEEKGYPMGSVWSDPLSLYVLEGGERHRIVYKDNAFLNEATGQTLTPSKLAADLKAHPDRYSTGVMLSPIAQDFCLPAVAHVAGPGGVAFFGLQKALFDHLYVAYPQVVPQISATLIDGPCERGLKTLGQTLEGLLGESQAAAEEGPDDAAILAGLREKVLEGYESYRGAVAAAASGLADDAKRAAFAAAGAADGIDAERGLDGAEKAGLEALAKLRAKLTSISASVSDEVLALTTKLTRAMPAALKLERLAEARDALARAAKAVEEAAGAPAPGDDGLGAELGPALEALSQKALTAQASSDATEAMGPETVKLILAPKGGLQEDTLAMVWLLGQHGPDLLERAAVALDVFDFRHQALYLG